MKVPYLSCNVKLDVYTTTAEVILPHELELISVKPNGSNAVTNIKPTGQFRDMSDEDIAEEYTKLRRKHGRDGESNRFWVEVAFGHPNKGRLKTSLERGAKYYGKSAQGIAGAAKAKSNKAAKAAAAAEPDQVAA